MLKSILRMDCFRGFVVFLIKNIKSKAFALYYGIECIPAAGCHQRILMSLFTGILMKYSS